MLVFRLTIGAELAHLTKEASVCALRQAAKSRRIVDIQSGSRALDHSVVADGSEGFARTSERPQVLHRGRLDACLQYQHGRCGRFSCVLRVNEDGRGRRRRAPPPVIISLFKLHISIYIARSLPLGLGLCRRLAHRQDLACPDGCVRFFQRGHGFNSELRQLFFSFTPSPVDHRQDP